MSSLLSRSSLLSLIVVFANMIASAGERSGISIPSPAVDAATSTTNSPQTAVIAGGCFWGIQSVFQHVKGVISATSGYSGGEAKTAQYEMVSTGETGHAESVKITYDPSQVTYGQLLRVFFSVAHDPTQLNRQGPDEGSQYRSVVFYSNDGQRRAAPGHIAPPPRGHPFHPPPLAQGGPPGRVYPAPGDNHDTLPPPPAPPHHLLKH